MAQQYRKPTTARTKSSFTDDSKLDATRNNRARHTKKESGDVKLPTIDFAVIDTSVKYFLDKVVNGHIDRANENQKIPVYHSSPETWAVAQKNGYLRDEKNKLMLPLVIFQKSGIEQVEDLMRQKLMEEDYDLGMAMKTRYSNKTPYDRFSKLINQYPVKEMYMLTPPDYVRISYDVIVWTNQFSQLNRIVENFIYHEGRAAGYPYKFVMKVDSYDFDSENAVGEDKIAKCNISMHLNAALIPEDVGDRANQRKTYSIRSLKLGTETVVDQNDLPD